MSNYKNYIKKSKKDSILLEYLIDKPNIFVKYICHKTKGTTLNIVLPSSEKVYYIAFIIAKLPVNIEHIYRAKK